MGETEDAALPLKGIRVLEVGQALAGPLAGSILADMGAEVIKVEKPDGGDDGRTWGPPFAEDGASLFFHAFNRNKKSVTLDVKDAGDVARLKALAAESDILIQNLRPGIVDELGIGPEALTAVNPRLIYCSIWAFGYKGPMRLKPGYDPLLQAFGAVMTLTGRPSDPPTFQAPAINDKATGMWCVIGALAALQQRHATGKGCVVDTSLFETAVSWVESQVNNYLETGKTPVRHGAASAVLAPYQAFETADRPICIAAGNDRIFVRMAKEMGHPEWPQDPRFENGPKRAGNRDAIVAAVQEVLLTAGRDEWIARLEKVGVPVAPINDVAELAAAEQTQIMGMIQKEPETGRSIVGLPISFGQRRPAIRTRSPKLGEHNESVLQRTKPDAAE
ncbi:crotonobetainyl-CoA:carnitine CoA-transferase CaiB-like acyl-CoA transferase [Constrictibacter sp. MBR-5]|jgi:crotonobetainyl-CoA:carnitine CoA-transferase CaiB-like acyl-CoA transferase|uniref:CaiB/BaiF CoA transferase family protein n=1 Tax=Constrictibacter sp. MBR-5 TaxID=3156467 RepID=UPI003395DFC7